MKSSFIIGVIGGVLLGVPPALACGHVRHCAPVKKAVVAAVPVAVVPVIVPTFAIAYQPVYTPVPVVAVTVQPPTIIPPTIIPGTIIPGVIGPAVPVAPAQPVQPVAPAPIAPPPQQPAQQQPPPNAGQSPEYLQVVSLSIQKNCAACHSGAAEKGAGFTMVGADNKVPPFSITEKRQIIKRINSDDAKVVMPPPSHGEKLSEKERAAFAEWLGVK